ncbi:hypothetical protein K8I61_01190 [bacterium]|nr:hypothetical protein [bacterium]
MRPRVFLAAMLAVVCVVALSGASSCKKKREDKKIRELSTSLCEAAVDFNKLVVWQNYSAASFMVVPSKRIDFLVDAERFGGAVKIENFAVVVCQTDATPPVRGLELPGTEPPPEEGAPPAATPIEPERPLVPADEAVDSVKNMKPPETDKSLYEAGINRPKQKDPSDKDKVYYGTVLVRYINRNILPSASVDTKLIKQYWVAVGDVWYCDFEWPEMIAP